MGIKSAISGAFERFVSNRYPLDYGNYDFMVYHDEDGTEHVERNMGTLDAYYSNSFRACLLAKARPLSSLPIHVYVREDGVRREATDAFSVAYSELLRHKWNPFMTGSDGYRKAVMTKDATGNFFARVAFSEGKPTAIYPLSAWPTVEVAPDGGALYRYGGDKFTPSGVYLSSEIVWIKSPITDQDGLYGKSLAELAANEIGLSINLERFYSHVLDGEAPVSGWLETDQKMDQQGIDALRQQLRDAGGLVNSGSIRVFDRGLKYRSTGQSPVDMNLVEQEKWILQQTCRTLSVPPQEVFELSHATYSNIEQGAINFANKTLVPECNALETALSSILWAAGLQDHYVQFDMNGLLRGSYRERMEGYRIAHSIGMYSANRLLAKEDELPYKGGDYHAISASYALIDPNTGDIRTLGRGNGRDPQPGGIGESDAGGRGNKSFNSADPDAMGTALAVIHADMACRIRERFEDTGDTEKFRKFAKNVLSSYAEALKAEGMDYDIEADIKEITR